MKCIQCRTDNNLKERTEHSGLCKNCRHPFVFEPTSMGEVKFTDPFFAKAIADISANNTLFFTPKQFWYFLDTRLKSKSFGSRFAWLFVVYVFLNLWVYIFTGGVIRLVLGDLVFIIVSIIFNLGFIWAFFRGSKSNKLTQKGRKASARSLQIMGAIILIVGVLVNLSLPNSFNIFTVYILLGILSACLGTWQLRHQEQIPQAVLIQMGQVQEWFSRWIQVNNSVQKMLPVPRDESTQTEVNSEIAAYSFDRVVVCDSAAIAQFLLANNFHFENNCAILSVTGYPQNVFSTVLGMLRQNLELKVYALHDASPRGVTLVNHLRTSENWFAGATVTIYDLGILPRQVSNKPNFFLRNSQESAQQARELPNQIRQELSADELQWLESGNFVELESFNPRKLLQIVTQGIATSRTLDSDDPSILLVSDDLSRDGTYIYAVDSFG